MCCRFEAINGVLIPGGGALLQPTHHFYDVAAQLVQLAMDANDQGIYFPVRAQMSGTAEPGTQDQSCMPMRNPASIV